MRAIFIFSGDHLKFYCYYPSIFMAIYTRFEYTSFLSFSVLPGPNDINVLIPLLIILLLFLLIVVAVIVICCKRYVRLSVIPFCAVIILLLVMVAVSVAVLGSNFIVIRRLEKLFHVCIVEIQNRFSIVLQVI